MARSNCVRAVACLFSVLIIELLSTPLVCIASPEEATALLMFKESADPANLLGSLWGTGDPCADKWVFVSCTGTVVQRLTIIDIPLSGIFVEDTLSRLIGLKVLTLSNNSLQGPIPDLTNIAGLAFLTLNNNLFNGSIPEFISTSRHLRLVDLSFNKLTGLIPPTVANAGQLNSLQLQNNSLSGILPELVFKVGVLQTFDVANNQLSGPVPTSLQVYSASAFEGNSGLCGLPLALCLSQEFAPNPHPLPPNPQPLPANPQLLPPEIAPVPSSPTRRKKKRISTAVIVAIVLGDIFLLLILGLFFLFCCWKKYPIATDEKPSIEQKPVSGKHDLSQPGHGYMVPETDRSKLMFLQSSSVFTFQLEDLLRASAEMLGKGSFGTSYKAVLETGMIVAVKRLREVRNLEKKEFEHQMEFLGRLQHPNLLPLRAYYYAKEEKLLVYDFMSNGSLFSLLHGNRGPGRTPLDWTSRLRCARGVALGLAYIHHECGSQKVPHGNIKSSNILLGKNNEIFISDFGLLPLMSSAMAAQLLAGYRAPEYSRSKKISQKADVYSYGVLLLELLTGRQPVQSTHGEGIDLPRWVQSVVREEWTAEVFDLELKSFRHWEEEMVSLLQIAMACVASSPDLRPRMAQVLTMVEEIRINDPNLESESVESSSEEFITSDSPFNL